MEFDFEKLFKYLRIENSLIVLGVLSLLISIYKEYILGIKLGFLFLSFGIIFRLHNVSIVIDIFKRYTEKFRYKRKILIYDKNKGKNIESEEYHIDLEKIWDIVLFEFTICLILVLIFVYLFICLITNNYQIFLIKYF